MSETPKTGQSVSAAVEIDVGRPDLLLLSDGQQYEEQVVVEADDGTTVELSITLIGEATDGT